MTLEKPFHGSFRYQLKRHLGTTKQSKIGIRKEGRVTVTTEEVCWECIDRLPKDLVSLCCFQMALSLASEGIRCLITPKYLFLRPNKMQMNGVYTYHAILFIVFTGYHFPISIWSAATRNNWTSIFRAVFAARYTSQAGYIMSLNRK